jgi:hypothetical protein
MTVAVLISSLQEDTETLLSNILNYLDLIQGVFHGGQTPFLSKSDEHNVNKELNE